MYGTEIHCLLLAHWGPPLCYLLLPHKNVKLVALMKNGMVHAYAQLHTCGVYCVHNFVLFPAQEMPFDTHWSLARSNSTNVAAPPSPTSSLH